MGELVTGRGRGSPVIPERTGVTRPTCSVGTHQGSVSAMCRSRVSASQGKALLTGVAAVHIHVSVHGS